MNNLITDLNIRLKRADAQGRRAFAYPLRMRITTIERVRDMFYDYAAQHMHEIHAMQEELIEHELMYEEYAPPEDARTYEQMRLGIGLPSSGTPLNEIAPGGST